MHLGFKNFAALSALRTALRKELVIEIKPEALGVLARIAVVDTHAQPEVARGRWYEVPLQRTEKLLRWRPLIGTTLSQLKLMLRSTRVSTGVPLRSSDAKYSPLRPDSLLPFEGCRAVCSIGIANPSRQGLIPWRTQHVRT